MNAFTSSWQPNELIFYGHFLLLLSSVCVSNGDWSCLFAFSVDSAPLHLHQPSPSFLPFSFALLWASHKPVLRRQMITSYRQPPQQAIAALEVAVLTKAKDVMGHRDTAAGSILRAGSGIRGNRSREEGVELSMQETSSNAAHTLWVKQNVAESFKLAPFSIKCSTHVDVQPGGLPYL